MSVKKLKSIIPPPPIEMVGNGFRVHRFFPDSYEVGEEGMSPFYLLDYNAKYDFAPSPTMLGVGTHPHRGLETVTIVYKGAVEHRDSTGNGGVIYEGDVQWMTAGGGILHNEYHEQEFCRKGGTFHLVQLWVNLRAKDKMTPPKYQPITTENMPRYAVSEHGGVVEVIAGNYEGVQGAASTFTPVELYNVRIKKGTKLAFSFPEEYSTGLLAVEGSVRINGEDVVPENHFGLFARDGEELTVEAEEDAVFLIMSGQPLDEPVCSGGPFLMNSREEIVEAFNDFRAGKFGTLDDYTTLPYK